MSTESPLSLFLLSGLLCDDTPWAEVASKISGAAEIKIVSFPGFDSITKMADRVLALAPQRFCVVGHSMGGRVALEVVRMAQDRVVGLGLFNTGVHACADHERESRGRLVRLAKENGMAALAAEWLPPMLGAPPARIAEVMPRLTAMVLRQTPEGFSAQVAALLNRPNAESVLPDIEVPVLLLSGTRDAWSPLAQHVDIQRRIPGAALAVIEDAGHMAPIEQPDAVAASLRTWMDLL